MRIPMSISFLLILLFTGNTSAAVSMVNVDQVDVDGIAKEFSANFLHIPVTPPHPLGQIFGLEIGIVAGITKSPYLNNLIQEADNTANELTDIAHANVLGSISLPYGITGELLILPALNASGLSLSNTSFGFKWTFSELMKSPIDLAMRLHLATNEISFEQTINNSSSGNIPVKAVVAWDTRIYGIDFMIGKDMTLIEPFFGMGFAKSKTDISIEASGTATIFDSSLTVKDNQGAESDNSSIHFFAGVQLDLPLLNIAAQYDRVFGTNSYTGKFSLSF